MLLIYMAKPPFSLPIFFSLTKNKQSRILNDFGLKLEVSTFWHWTPFHPHCVKSATLDFGISPMMLSDLAAFPNVRLSLKVVNIRCGLDSGAWRPPAHRVKNLVSLAALLRTLERKFYLKKPKKQKDDTTSSWFHFPAYITGNWL